jgi:ABC-type antimicrobial peptide transport system permease subunit
MMIGLCGSLVSARLIATMLFGIRPIDPGTWMVIAGLTSGACLLASYIPTRRAACVDPLVALRYE